MSFDSSKSANSGNKSKRSLNSKSGNSSNISSNSNNKKQKTQQKTLGMAWGPNSRSSSHSSFRSAPFSNFGSYMAVKNRKLHDQFDAQASTSSHSGSGYVKPIFHGVSIFVDGFTVPSSQELRGYMLKYGGRFENYFSRHHVTHIICCNLPDSKIRNLRSFSCGLPVVKPTWVLDSVAANKLLSWVPYQIDQLANESRNQPKLSAFFAPKKFPDVEDATNGAICHVIPEIGDSTSIGGTLKEATLSEVDNLVETTRQSSGGSDDPVHECSTGALTEEPNSSLGKSSELKMAEVSKVDTEYQNGVTSECSPLRPSTSVSSYCLDNKATKGSRSSTVGSSSRRHSTLEDPNFVENYFKNSRLHFIGTWRNRYRKRFQNLSKGVVLTSSKLSASTTDQKTCVIHLDMDCFFVSVVIRNHSELHDKPVAVCHSDNPRGTAEISSANYPARDYGVRAGMFVRDAKALCPHLVIVPYKFDAYEEVADQFYNILHKHCNKVQAVSCDEAFLEVADSNEEDPQLLASIIRKEIFETTGCTASAGIAGNMLMARLATRTAKPDGQCYIPPAEVDDFLCKLPIKALPGIGYVLEDKLKKQQVRTCGELRLISKETLQKDFGMKTGNMLWSYSRGVDNRLVGLIQENKSIGAEVNWGVRFRDLKDYQHFLINLCKEVSLRLQGCGVQGRTFTLKIKKRRKNAEEPAKYMGCGDCENMSHSITVPIATDDVEVVQRITKQLFGAFHVDVKEIRGVGLQVSRLENEDAAKQGGERNSLKSWLTSALASSEEHCNSKCLTEKRAEVDCERQRTDQTPGQLWVESALSTCQIHNNMVSGSAGVNQVSDLPPLCQLDMGVIESLPPELFSELNDMYGGKLVDFISENKGDCGNISNPMTRIPCELVEGARNKEEGSAFSSLISLNRSPVDNEEGHPGKKTHAAPGNEEGSSNVVMHTLHLEQTDLMPQSISQVDTSVLQQLPEELRVGILEALPEHRMAERASNAALDSFRACPQEASGVKGTENNSGLMESVPNDDFWMGNPPEMVNKFKMSNFVVLRVLAEMYFRSGATGQFSSILQSTLSLSHQSLDFSCDGCDEAIEILSDFLKQYIKLKMESDIEEIYVCFRLLKRLRVKSEVFFQAYNVVYPYLQDMFVRRRITKMNTGHQPLQFWMPFQFFPVAHCGLGDLIIYITFVWRLIRGSKKLG